MGVMYHAHARFFDKSGNKITVPSPVDPETPNARFWYDYIAHNAQSWSKAGFTAVMLPPVCKTQSGNKPTGDGYGVFDQYDIGWKNQCYSVETRFGNREQLQRAVATCRACGLDVYVDAVMHQLEGSNGGDGVYQYLGADGKLGTGRFPKHPGCFRGDPPRRPEDPVPVPFYDFAFGDEFVYKNSDPPNYTTDGMVEWGDWLTRSLDVQGYRVDDTKGTWVGFVHHWMTQKSMASRFCTSEYFDGNPDNLAWWVWSQMGGRSSVYDFTLHWALQDMCGGGSMRSMDGRGYAARDPFHAVTFVDNPDTDTSPGQQIVGSKLLAYAYILTTEGYPAVYHKDYAQEPNCYGLKPHIDNLVWIHEKLANGRTATRYIDDHVVVMQRLGAPGLLTALNNDTLNARTVHCWTSFPPGWQLHDYTGHHPTDIWVQNDGSVEFTVPSNYFGGGQSYVCFAPAGLGEPIKPQGIYASQEFFGAADLDIRPLDGQPVTLPRIAVSGAKPMQFWLALDDLVWQGQPSVALQIADEQGHIVATKTWTRKQETPFEVLSRAAGMYTLTLTGSNLTAPVPFVLKVRYLAPSYLK